MDETYLGGQEPGLPGGRARGKKMLTAIAVEAHAGGGLGRCRMAPIENAKNATLRAFSRSAGYSVRIKARWAALTSQATSTSSCSDSTDVRREAEACCFTGSWSLQLPMGRCDTTSCSSPVTRAPEPGLRHAAGGGRRAYTVRMPPALGDDPGEAHRIATTST